MYIIFLYEKKVKFFDTIQYLNIYLLIIDRNIFIIFDQTYVRKGISFHSRLNAGEPPASARCFAQSSEITIGKEVFYKEISYFFSIKIFSFQINTLETVTVDVQPVRDTI